MIVTLPDRPSSPSRSREHLRRLALSSLPSLRMRRPFPEPARLLLCVFRCVACAFIIVPGGAYAVKSPYLVMLYILAFAVDFLVTRCISSTSSLIARDYQIWSSAWR